MDYIPTLYVAALKKLKKTKEVYDLYYLYMNTDIQLSGIIGYSILPFIEYDKVHLKKIYNDIFSYANDIEKIDRNKKHIFIDKILLLDIYLNSNMKKGRIFI